MLKNACSDIETTESITTFLNDLDVGGITSLHTYAAIVAYSHNYIDTLKKVKAHPPPRTIDSGDLDMGRTHAKYFIKRDDLLAMVRSLSSGCKKPNPGVGL